MAKHSHRKRGMDKPVSLQSGIKPKTRDQCMRVERRGFISLHLTGFLPIARKTFFSFKLNRTDSEHRQSSRDLMLRVICILLYPM